MKFSFSKSKKPSGIPQEKWDSWTWQMQQSAKTANEFSQHFSLNESEVTALNQSEKVFNVRTTPYYASLCTSSHLDPLRRIMVPTEKEFSLGEQGLLDPLGEKQNSPTPRIVHRYSDRVLFLITDICSVYCRYCTRKHFTGQDQAFVPKSEYIQALEYVRTHKGIREVILSGGDPLTLSDSILDQVLTDLRSIEHIEIIRIGSRMPVVCPQRITPQLLQVFKKAKPLYLMTHFNHPRELTQESASALESLVDHGVPVFNQMVLLNGVNNHPAIVQALSRRLLYLRVKPYYMFQCDPSEGTDHLRTTVEESLEIQRALWGHLSGLAMPTLSLDIPGGGGKTTLVPNFQIQQKEGVRTFQGWDGVVAEYRNPLESQKILPEDYKVYLSEWNEVKNAKSTSSTISSLDEHTLPQTF